MTYLSEQKDGTVSLMVYLQPRASRNRIAGTHANALKLSVTSPPVAGKANKALIDFLAKFFHIPKTAITLKSGQQSRTKHLVIKDISLSQVRRLIDLELQES